MVAVQLQIPLDPCPCPPCTGKHIHRFQNAQHALESQLLRPMVLNDEGSTFLTINDSIGYTHIWSFNGRREQRCGLSPAVF